MATSALETERSNLFESIKKLTVPQQSKLNAYLKFNHLSIDSIAQDTVLENNVKRKIEALTLKEPEPKTKKAKKVKDHGKHLTIYSKVRSLALKFYPEQLMRPETREEETDPQLGRIPFEFWQDETMLKLAKSAMKDRVDKFSERFNKLKSPRDTKKRHWEIEAICHDRDYKADPDDMSLPSVVKPHFHLILRDANGNRFTVKTILKALNLFYDPKKDSKLFYEQGCTTVKNFSSYSMYLTHETDQAQIDGKEVYDISEVITNMTLKELQDIRAGYSRVQAKSKLTEEDWNNLADYVAKLGDKMGDFEAWANQSLSFVQRTSKKFKDLQVLYNQHLLEAVEKSPDLVRCCILISGKQNDGKSWTTRHALQDMGEIVYNARSSTGKYDGLSSRATAMIFDDRKMTDALNVSDNRATVLHSRGTGNDKPWLGKYVVITTNLSPDDFYKGQVMDLTQVPAIKSRFYTTSLLYDASGRARLALIKPSTRGTKEDIAKRNELYKNFADHFNKLIKDYTPLSPDDAPKLDKSYYKDTQLHRFCSSNVDALLNDTVSLYDHNMALSTKLGRLITLLCTTVDGLSNKIFYTGMINATYSFDYPRLIEFLHDQSPDAKVYKEDSVDGCTVAEFLKKLPKPTTLEDYKFEVNDDKFELTDCEYIRIG